MKFSIIIPTMWMSHKIEQMMPLYLQHSDDIIIIDNAPGNRLFYDKRIKYLTEGRNIFVNPAWNWGVREAKNDIVILANDDVIIKDYMKIVDLFMKSNYDIVGMDTHGCRIDGEAEIRPAFQLTWGWGCFMILRKSAYYEIPEQFKIWFGDNILFMRNFRRGSFSGVKVITQMSETIKQGFWEQARAEEPLFKKWYDENIHN